MLTDSQRKLVNEVAERAQGEGGSFLHTVMFDHPKKGKVFGVADMFDDDAFAQAKEGRIIVHDVVYPSSRGPYAVKAEKLTALSYRFGDRPEQDSLPGKLGFFTWGGCPKEDYCMLEGLAHEIRAERNDREELMVNDMFSIGVADGSAEYVVTRVSGNRCDVEWRGFWNGDRYRDHHYQFGRKNVSVNDVVVYVPRARGIDPLPKRFGSKESIDKPKAFAKLMKEYEKTHGFPAPVEL